MRFLKLEQDEGIEDVAARLAASRSPAARERTLEALRRANPQLAAEARAAVGERILVIPDEVDPAGATGSASAPKASVNALLTDARARLAEAQRVVPEEIGRQQARASEALATFDTAEAKRLARGRPQLAKQLDQVRAAAEERVARLQLAESLHADAIATMQTDLESLGRIALERSSLGGAILDLGMAVAPSPAPTARTKKEAAAKSAARGGAEEAPTRKQKKKEKEKKKKKQDEG